MKILCILFCFFLLEVLVPLCVSETKILEGTRQTRLLQRFKRQTAKARPKKITFFDKNVEPENLSGEDWKNLAKIKEVEGSVPMPPELVRIRGELRDLNINEGRVEAYNPVLKKWGPICDDYWDMNSATVACRQLGFTRGAQKAWRNDHYPMGDQWSKDDLQFHSLRCMGKEEKLQACGVDDQDFCSGKSAGVTCLYNTGCPFGWTAFGGTCYKVILKNLDFVKARAECARFDAKLVNILDDTENNFISNMLRTKFQNITRIWTGGYFLETKANDSAQAEGKWSWIDTIHPFDYTTPLWFPGLYSGSVSSRPTGNPRTRSCVALSRVFADSRQNNQATDINYFWWENLSCKQQLPLVCQVMPPKSKSDCYNGRGVDYRGRSKRTLQGSVCARWTHPDAIINDKTHKKKGLGFHAYCRNPDNDIMPWCWIDPSRRVFGYCNIPRCDAILPKPTIIKPPTDAAGFGKGGCPAEKFFCPSMIDYGTPCLNTTYVCDGFPQCEGKEDETGSICEDHLCSDQEFYCAPDKYCILNSYRCNGRRLCSDGSDEKNCTDIVERNIKERFTAYPNKVLQNDSRTVNYVGLTKGACMERCLNAYLTGFVCRSFNYYPKSTALLYGQCVLLSKTVIDLPNDRLVDDSAATHYSPKQPCTPDTFQCKNGVCVMKTLTCNGKNDCGDFSDEVICEKAEENFPPFQIRLNGGKNPWEGRVEVRHHGEWGLVCDDSFDINAARVVCRELKFPGAIKAVKFGGRKYGRGNSNFLMDDVKCLGNETSLEDCQHNLRVHDCNKEEVGAVVCHTVRACAVKEYRCKASGVCIPFTQVCDGVPDCDDGTDEKSDCTMKIKLENGTDTEGRVVVQRGDISGTVCEDMFSDHEAEVICRMLGIPGRSVAVTDHHFGPGRGLVVLDNMRCYGNETSLDKCRDYIFGASDCDHSEDVGVRCGLPELPDTPEGPATKPPPPKPGVFCGSRPIMQQRRRVVGGFEALYGAYPWQVGVRRIVEDGDVHHCGGTILSEFWVISAAHCYFEYTKADFKIRVGDLNNNEVDQHEQEFEIGDLMLHPKWDSETYDWDLALIKIRPNEDGKGIQFSDYIQPACLPDKDTEPDFRKKCFVSGWGDTGSYFPEKLLAADVPLITDEDCGGMYKGVKSERMQCAGYTTGGIDTCQGDSGGPLVCFIEGKHVVWGATSWGNGCALPNQPGIYSKIRIFLDWVHEILGS